MTDFTFNKLWANLPFDFYLFTVLRQSGLGFVILLPQPPLADVPSCFSCNASQRNDVTGTQGMPVSWLSEDNVLKIADDCPCAKSSASPHEHLTPSTLTDTQV